MAADALLDARARIAMVIRALRQDANAGDGAAKAIIRVLRGRGRLPLWLYAYMREVRDKAFTGAEKVGAGGLEAVARGGTCGY